MVLKIDILRRVKVTNQMSINVNETCQYPQLTVNQEFYYTKDYLTFLVKFCNTLITIKTKIAITTINNIKPVLTPCPKKSYSIIPIFDHLNHLARNYNVY